MSSQPPRVPTEWVGLSDRGLTYMVVSCVVISLSFLTVVLRLVARLSSLGKLLIDDYLCIAAQIVAFGLMAVGVVFAKDCGMGWHVTEVPPAQLMKFFEVFYSAEIMYGIVTALYKLAVIFLYRHIFGESRTFNILSWAMIALTLCWWISGFFSSVFQCTPIEKTWNFLLPGTCVDREAYILGLGISNLLLDVAILLMPFPWIWRLNLSGSKKVAITGMFLLGAVVCIATIFRITTLVPLNLTDPTYHLFYVAVWSEVEPAVGIIAACLPTLRQFFFRWMPDRAKSSRGYSYSSKAKSPLDSLSKSNGGDVPLTVWRPDEGYTEVEIKSSTPSNPHTPTRLDLESGQVSGHSFLDDDLSRLTAMHGDDKSILVKKETSIEVYE